MKSDLSYTSKRNQLRDNEVRHALYMNHLMSKLGKPELVYVTGANNSAIIDVIACADRVRLNKITKQWTGESQ